MPLVRSLPLRISFPVSVDRAFLDHLQSPNVFVRGVFVNLRNFVASTVRCISVSANVCQLSLAIHGRQTEKSTGSSNHRITRVVRCGMLCASIKLRFMTAMHSLRTCQLTLSVSFLLCATVLAQTSPHFTSLLPTGVQL